MLLGERDSYWNIYFMLNVEVSLCFIIAFFVILWGKCSFHFFSISLKNSQLLFFLNFQPFDWSVFTVWGIIFTHKLFASAGLARTRHQDHWCSKWGQRQCEVPVHPWEVLWPAVQQQPCKACSAMVTKFVPDINVRNKLLFYF